MTDGMGAASATGGFSQSLIGRTARKNTALQESNRYRIGANPAPNAVKMRVLIRFRPMSTSG
ncbi:hypothetical protein IP90_03067 [Luteimonas cucumeris]|uniref:Uncharacterized protein n=1 Tax=Luteimonas cucumeris TaxID=985012 RepID=A0A562KWF5_9GAMM|nr:hypothetical protein IP90_03067 [Luteimonas cucumeris]